MRTDDDSLDEVLADWPDFTLIRDVTPFVEGKPCYVPGEVDEDVFERLCELSQDPLQVGWQRPWFMKGSPTPCNLCGFTGGGETTYVARSQNWVQPRTYVVSARAPGMLWVPGDGFLWACSANITHQIDAHRFAPPAEFCEAVRRCPPMRSDEYLKALALNGGRSGGIYRV